MGAPRSHAPSSGCHSSVKKSARACKKAGIRLTQFLSTIGCDGLGTRDVVSCCAFTGMAASRRPGCCGATVLGRYVRLRPLLGIEQFGPRAGPAARSLPSARTRKRRAGAARSSWSQRRPAGRSGHLPSKTAGRVDPLLLPDAGRHTVADVAAQAGRSADVAFQKQLDRVRGNAAGARSHPRPGHADRRAAVFVEKEVRSLHQRRHDGDLVQPALSRFDGAAGMPSGRRAENLDPAGRSPVRIPPSHSGRRAARPLLVPPAHSRLQQGAGARRGFRRADHRRHRAGQSDAGGPARARFGDPRSGSVES